MTTRTVLNHRLAAVAVALAAVATLVLIAQVAQPSETTAGATIVSPSDGSFDQAEYRRHRRLIEHRTEGFDRAITTVSSDSSRRRRSSTDRPDSNGPRLNATGDWVPIERQAGSRGLATCQTPAAVGSATRSLSLRGLGSAPTDRAAGSVDTTTSTPGRTVRVATSAIVIISAVSNP